MSFYPSLSLSLFPSPFFVYLFLSLTLSLSLSPSLPPSLPLSLQVGSQCQCADNTQGVNCEQCLPLFNDRPWKTSTELNEMSDPSTQCQGSLMFSSSSTGCDHTAQYEFTPIPHSTGCQVTRSMWNDDLIEVLLAKKHYSSYVYG